MIKVDTFSFIEKAKIVHNNYYDYSKVIYSKSISKVIIICPIHGEFSQTPNNHLNKRGCKKCNKGLVYSQDEFIKISNERHNNKYDYSVSEYKKSNEKIDIVCPIHGVFNMLPNNHLRGQGCKKCFNGNHFSKERFIENRKGKKGIFYIIRCWNENEEFFKVGLTTVSIKKRYCNTSYMPYKYEIIREIQSFDLGYIWDLEKEIILKSETYHYTPLIKFKGCKNECFSNIEFLNQKINELKTIE